jgi:tape measure domain-containing protein
MLQLSQAMGSGALQGDELRSVMERLPAIGQAIAQTMGVPVSQIKQLGSEGKITTDIIVQAMDELSKMQPPPPDAYKQFQKALADLNTTIGQQLLPVFTPLVQKLGELVAKFRELGVGTTIANALKPLGEALLGLLNAFLSLPAPVQSFIIQAGVLAGAFALIAAPLGFIVSGIGSLLGAVGAIVPAVAGFGATVAGWAGALGPVIAALGALGKILVGVFSGPVGWIALAVAAGVAIYAFRDKIGNAFNLVGDVIKGAAQDFNNFFVKPTLEKGKALYNGLVKIFSTIANALKVPFQAVANMIRGVFNFVIGAINNQIKSIVNAVNFLARQVNRVAARLKLPTLPLLNAPQIPMLADGGIVTKPTLAMIGEGGEPEVVLPL